MTALSTASDGDLGFAFLPSSNNSLSVTPGSVVVRMNPNGTTVQIPGRVGSAETTVTSMAPGPDASLWINNGGTGFSRVDLSSVPTFAPPIVYPTTVNGITTDAKGNVSGTIISFTAYDGGATSSDFTAVINWGDGTTSTGTVAANQNGGYDVTGTHTYKAAAGTVENITVTVQEGAQTAQVFNEAQVAGAGASTTTSTPLVALGGRQSRAAARAAAKAALAAKIATRKASMAARRAAHATSSQQGLMLAPSA